jgi:hypothetical protein
LENPRASQSILSSDLHIPLGPRKTPPDTEFRNPADLADQFAFLARVLLFIPRRAIFRFPVRFGPRRKRRNEKGGCMRSVRKHQFNLLVLELLKVITVCDQRSRSFIAFPLPFKGVSAGHASSMEARATACAEYSWWL